MKHDYAGWTNHETWNANLWLDERWQDSELVACMATDLFSSYGDTEEIAGILAVSIKTLFIENAPELENGFYMDMILSSIHEVNWYEIAQHYVENEVAARELELDTY